MKWLKAILGGNPLDSVVNAIDALHTSTEEKEALKLQFIKQQIEEKKIDMQNLSDARALYVKDSILQKVFAIVFLTAYVGITYFLLHSISVHELDNLTQWEAGFVSGVFGAMSAKVNTITDFLFGGSQSEKETINHLKNGSKN